MLTLVLVLLAADAPPITPTNKGPELVWGAEFGRVSLLVDTNVGTGVGVELLAVPYLDVQAELGFEPLFGSTERGFAIRAGPSGNLFTLRNGRGEGLSMRGALLGGVFTQGKPYFALHSQLEVTFWVADHLGVSLGMSGGFNTRPFFMTAISPDIGFRLGLAF
jgi:hypothetical protein